VIDQLYSQYGGDGGDRAAFRDRCLAISRGATGNSGGINSNSNMGRFFSQSDVIAQCQSLRSSR